MMMKSVEWWKVKNKKVTPLIVIGWFPSGWKSASGHHENQKLNDDNNRVFTIYHLSIYLSRFFILCILSLLFTCISICPCWSASSYSYRQENCRLLQLPNPHQLTTVVGKLEKVVQERVPILERFVKVKVGKRKEEKRNIKIQNGEKGREEKDRVGIN